MITTVTNDMLSKEEVRRYGRQLVLKGFDKKCQRKLLDSSVLIVGAGGLGCPVAAYLAGAGIGTVGIVDDDVVDESNLHRQILHTERDSGVTYKVDSIRDSIRNLNSNVKCVVHRVRFGAGNAMDLVKPYDVVVDCSDNPATRYLVNDACVLSGRPLVFGACVGFDGQVSVMNASKSCPCYRCIHPKPASLAAVGSCSNNGVMGPVVGIVGSMMALETVKLIGELGDTLTGRLCVVDSWGSRFRNMRLPSRRSETCLVCRSIIGKGGFTMADSQAFCQEHNLCSGGATSSSEHLSRLVSNAAKLEKSNVCTCEEYVKLRMEPHILLDVRPSHHFSICSLPNSKNLPIQEIRRGKFSEIIDSSSSLPIFTICRRGNDSQLAARALLDRGYKNVRHIEGGLQEWAESVDKTFPMY